MTEIIVSKIFAAELYRLYFSSYLFLGNILILLGLFFGIIYLSHYIKFLLAIEVICLGLMICFLTVGVFHEDIRGLILTIYILGFAALDSVIFLCLYIKIYR